jgi:pimeloyl-ACP methyl ester carboxylesterase
MIWYESGGTGPRTVLLLHGLGATAAVWHGVERALERAALGRWIAPDLSGHGSSDSVRHYSVGQLATEVAQLPLETRSLSIVGHSLGAYVGLALASRWFGVEVDAVLGLGPKISWSESDLQQAHDLAARPLRWYASGDEAWARYRRVSGLDLATAPEEHWLARGVRPGEQGWRLSQDPATFAVAGAPFATLRASAVSRVALARGEHDSLVSDDELKRYAQEVHVIADAGHNAHVEKPDAIVEWLAGLVRNV